MMDHAAPPLLLTNLVFVLLLAATLYLLARGRVLRLVAVSLFGLFAFVLRCLTWLFNKLRAGGVLRPSTVVSAVSGVLAPGDAPPHPHRHRDYLDYRGCASLAELSALRAPGLPLGRFQHPRGRSGPTLHLPVSLLQRGCAVVGPSGSGKTEGLVLPWIRELLCLGASVVTCDIKGDLIDRLRPHVARLGARLWYWNSADTARSQSWNWLDELREQRDFEAATQSILGRPRPGDSQPFFYERDVRWLRTLLLVVKAAYGDSALPRYLYSLVSDQATLRGLFSQCDRVRRYATELADLLQFAPEDHSRAVSGLLNALHLFRTPSVVAISERSDFVLSRIDEVPTLLVVGASLADAKLAEVMSSLALNRVFNVIYNRFSRGCGVGATPIYCVVDEAPRLKERIQFEEVLSVVRSAEAGVCIALQDINQMGDQRQQNAILANCATLLTLRGASVDAARYLASRLGQRADRGLVLTRSRGPFDLFSSHSSNAQMTMLPVLGEREIMHPPGPPYTAVAHVAPISAKPFLIDLDRVPGS